MKNIILFVIVLIVSGCVAQSKKLCAAYGFAKGTRGFSNCVMTETHRSQDSWNRMGAEMQESNQQYQKEPEQTYNLFKPSITCRTRRGFLGNSTTTCN